jgi:beta-phosphoglucomutase-like phosphatase (HAD superfamily)
VNSFPQSTWTGIRAAAAAGIETMMITASTNGACSQSAMIRCDTEPPRAGITGWAQVNGLRGEADTVEKMRKRVG